MNVRKLWFSFCLCCLAQSYTVLWSLTAKKEHQWLPACEYWCECITQLLPGFPLRYLWLWSAYCFSPGFVILQWDRNYCEKPFQRHWVSWLIKKISNSFFLLKEKWFSLWEIHFMFMIKHVWLDVLTTLTRHIFNSTYFLQNLHQVAELSVKMNV